MPPGDAPDFVMQRAAQYIEDVMPVIRKEVQKKEAPPKKAKPGQEVRVYPSHKLPYSLTFVTCTKRQNQGKWWFPPTFLLPQHDISNTQPMGGSWSQQGHWVAALMSTKPGQNDVAGSKM
jgi:hypothetical protein